MAVPKKGWRPISVGGETYHWRAIGDCWGIRVVVVTAAAFERGKTAQQLHFLLDYDHKLTPHPDRAVGLQQQAVVAPGIVRLAIECSISLAPPFTGEHGAPDISLPCEIIADLQAAARHAVLPS